eukprot:Cvel_30202.t1-p1 / transcript=Cvel_30202.t1 / gene=Cvel_30202 / organism=Chromera_velia_CCMP2878 / gene_product=hypothetical protein / transcript_product=hypothetical protein / location=Cvel_scaffold4273:9509-10384(+) / protein_length=292 / sequence_SO=supercontig / SO=protein_coding / is_pseudo=false
MEERPPKMDHRDGAAGRGGKERVETVSSPPVVPFSSPMIPPVPSRLDRQSSMCSSSSVGGANSLRAGLGGQSSAVSEHEHPQYPNTFAALLLDEHADLSRWKKAFTFAINRHDVFNYFTPPPPPSSPSAVPSKRERLRTGERLPSCASSSDAVSLPQCASPRFSISLSAGEQKGEREKGQEGRTGNSGSVLSSGGLESVSSENRCDQPMLLQQQEEQGGQGEGEGAIGLSEHGTERSESHLSGEGQTKSLRREQRSSTVSIPSILDWRVLTEKELGGKFQNSQQAQEWASRQ